MLTLRTAAVISPSGSVTPIHASVLSVGDRVPVQLGNKDREVGSTNDSQKQTRTAFRHSRDTTLIVKLEQQAVFPASGPTLMPPSKALDGVLKSKAAAQARLMLLNELRASANREGDSFQAVLVEPVFVDGAIGLPEGTLFEGKISKSVPPRRLNRSGKLHLSLDWIILPTGHIKSISASLSGAESDGRVRLTLDPEGSINASRPGKAAMVLDVGASWLFGKLVDDLVEEGFKWSAEAVASGTTAAAARYVGMGAGVIMFVLQKGHDVRLPSYAEIEVAFNRSVILDPIRSTVDASPLDDTASGEENF